MTHPHFEKYLLYLQTEYLELNKSTWNFEKEAHGR